MVLELIELLSESLDHLGLHTIHMTKLNILVKLVILEVSEVLLILKHRHEGRLDLSTHHGLEVYLGEPRMFLDGSTITQSTLFLLMQHFV